MGLTSAPPVATLCFVRTVFLALVLAAGCGGSGPMLYETSKPAGQVIDALESPEAFAKCEMTEEEWLARSSCVCATRCAEGQEPSGARCVALGAPVEPTRGACSYGLGGSEAREGCEVPVWPLFRCEPGRF